MLPDFQTDPFSRREPDVFAALCQRLWDDQRPLLQGEVADPLPERMADVTGTGRPHHLAEDMARHLDAGLTWLWPGVAGGEMASLSVTYLRDAELVGRSEFIHLPGVPDPGKSPILDLCERVVETIAQDINNRHESRLASVSETLILDIDGDRASAQPWSPGPIGALVTTRLGLTRICTARFHPGLGLTEAGWAFARTLGYPYLAGRDVRDRIWADTYIEVAEPLNISHQSFWWTVFRDTPDPAIGQRIVDVSDALDQEAALA